MAKPERVPPKKIRPRLEDRPDAQPEPGTTPPSTPSSPPPHPASPPGPVSSPPDSGVSIPITKLGDPTGIIGGPLKIAFGRGGRWAGVNRYDALFLAAGAKHHVPPAMLKAMAVIESGGFMIPNAGGSGAFGVMQIKAAIWGARAKALGYDLNTPAGQIGMAAAILGGDTSGVTGTTPEDRFLSTYYPTPCLDCKGEDGATPRQYLADMHELMRQIEAAASGTTPAPKPEPEPVDIVDAIVGGAAYTDDYGFKAPTDLPYYEYFQGHGGQSNQHTGIDVTGNIGESLYSPISGTVVCAGTSTTAAGAFGTSCAAFGYTLGAAGPTSGRFEIMADDGKRTLILGHVLRSVVPIGAKVQPGQKVAELGGMNGPHVHVEARVWQGGNYTIVDPRQAFGGGVIYAERIPIPQPADFDVSWNVRALKDGVPVLQRADLNASPVRKPLTKDEEFDAVYVVIGNDGNAYWISSLGSRIPVDGTEAIGGPVIKVA